MIVLHYMTTRTNPKKGFSPTKMNKEIGTDIRRDRAATCAKFLAEYINSHSDDYDFTIEQIEKGKGKGKYYANKKADVDIESLLNIIDSMKRDKYISAETIRIIQSKLRSLYTNAENKKWIDKEISKQYLNVKAKYPKNHKIVRDAFEQNKSISIRVGYPQKEFSYEDYGVYEMMVFNFKQYALLIALDDNNKFDKMICAPVEDLIIKRTRPFNGNVKKTCAIKCGDYWRKEGKKYKDIDEMIEKNIFPLNFTSTEVSFSFREEDKPLVEHSYACYFSKALNAIGCHQIKFQNGETAPGYKVENLRINKSAFISWLTSEVPIYSAVSGEKGGLHIEDIVYLEGKDTIESMKKYHQSRMSRYQ